MPRTAVTFSYMSANTFEGCAIMPGVDIALEALSQNGAQLPQISMAQVDTPLGRNTVDSMRAGLLYPCQTVRWWYGYCRHQWPESYSLSPFCSLLYTALSLLSPGCGTFSVMQ